MVAVDCVSLPRTKCGYVGILIMVDHKSKYLFAAPLKNKKSEYVANLVQSNMFPMMIMKPKKILSDNGPEFSGSAFRDMLREFGISHVFITPYIASANGLAERTVKTLCEILRLMTKNEHEWDEVLAKALFAYNNTFHAALNCSPRNYLLSFRHRAVDKIQLNETERDIGEMLMKDFGLSRLVTGS
jgi:transposase InsO family protein